MERVPSTSLHVTYGGLPELSTVSVTSLQRDASQKNKQNQTNLTSKQTRKQSQQFTVEQEALTLTPGRLHRESRVSDLLPGFKALKFVLRQPRDTSLLIYTQVSGLFSVMFAKDDDPSWCLTFRWQDALLSVVVAHSWGDWTGHLFAFRGRKHFIHLKERQGSRQCLLQNNFFSVLKENNKCTRQVT